MNPRLQNPSRTAFLPVVALLALPAPASLAAQLVALKTAPIATGEQYVVFPSRTLAMGGVSYALRDPLADPFQNPARGLWSGGTRLFASPTFYDIAEQGADAGAGTTVSVGALVRARRVFLGGALALQQIDDPLESRTGLTGAAGSPGEPRDNRYLHGLAGFVLPGGRTAVGVAAWQARLATVDGISRLYPNSIGLRQDGGILDLRAGVLHELAADRWLEAVFVHDRVDIRHDVAYIDRRGAGSIWWEPPFVTHQREEMNLDRTRTTGLHLGYVMPVDTGGWKLGIALTANWKEHPKIPNYELASIPRDPGRTRLYSIGIGFAQERERSTFGMDFAWQPARSHTWAEAAEPTPTNAGTVIAPGGRTIENRFRFSNLHIALGQENRFNAAALQFGFAISAYSYALAQRDHVRLMDRELKESWIEWTPTWGALFYAGTIELRLTGRMVNRGFVPLWEDRSVTEVVVPPPALPGQDFLVAPARPVNLPDFRVFTTQFSIVVPIGAGPSVARGR